MSTLVPKLGLGMKVQGKIILPCTCVPKFYLGPSCSRYWQHRRSLAQASRLRTLTFSPKPPTYNPIF
jgi:hypothetical protein